MSRPSAGILFAVLLATWIVEAGLLFGKGILLIDQHEGDALHLLQIALRMGSGEWPHLDFMTPIGLFAVLPVGWLMSLGVGAGHAVMGGQVLVALALLPAIWWAGFSRLSALTAHAFGIFTIVLVTALVYGGADQVASISMYYNRWAWALAFVLVVLAILPAGRKSEIADGVVIGPGLAFLFLGKKTFFVALAPGILLALVLRRQWHTCLIAVAGGLAVSGLVTLAAGTAFWPAYIGDLRLVATSGIRPQPGDSLSAVLFGPSYIAGNACLLAAVILLREGGNLLEGLLLLVFAPAFVYVTYQNWGNDPKWLFLIAIILISQRPERNFVTSFGWDAGRSMSVVSLIAIALYLPSLMNITTANFRHASLSREGFFQVLPGTKNGDIGMKTDRMYAPAKRVAIELTDDRIRGLVDAVTNRDSDLLFGQPLPPCKLEMGLVSVLHQMSRDLENIDGTVGATVFTADTFSNLWMFGSTVPLPGGAPWYYGGDAGMSGADYVLIPLCPVTPRARSLVLAEIAKRPGLALSEVARNDLFILLRRPKS